ncbi:acyloxyacyl hydrolase [Caldimonas brevitalea]|uniref:Lipid A deacylase n=1 Tax=Caldimonas brevitalea TaxID=413882 RepID=A0A0G3BDI5_9BURK|nr:acyloxyacyl hydrolase [Caldimonas brevitalea]AKJ27454.1 hypothetical protein AAW51_0763 [Caldimonas brevitalea]
MYASFTTGRRRIRARLARPLAASALMLVSLGFASAESRAAGWEPEIGFLQQGWADGVRATTAGVIWPWSRHWAWGGGHLSGYWEAALSRWSADGGDQGRDRSWITQVGVTPVFRWRPGGQDGAWFVEGGIGLTLMTPIYRNGNKRFSTAFNFGDHLAIGRNLGQQGRHELSLRVQHFSNAGIRHPNPGEDFVQLRYALSFR